MKLKMNHIYNIALYPLMFILAYLAIYVTPVICDTIESCPRCDVNRDGIVDIIDLTIVGKYFGQTLTATMYPNPDVNQDGVVNILDLVLVGKHFGEKHDTFIVYVLDPLTKKGIPDVKVKVFNGTTQVFYEFGNTNTNGYVNLRIDTKGPYTILVSDENSGNEKVKYSDRQFILTDIVNKSLVTVELIPYLPLESAKYSSFPEFTMRMTNNDSEVSQIDPRGNQWEVTNTVYERFGDFPLKVYGNNSNLPTAIVEWESRTGLNLFELTNNPDLADIIITTQIDPLHVVKIYGDIEILVPTYDGLSKVEYSYGNNQKPTRVTLLVDESLSGSSSELTELIYLLGRALGLGDSTDSMHLMGGATQISNDEVNLVRVLSGLENFRDFVCDKREVPPSPYTDLKTPLELVSFSTDKHEGSSNLNVHFTTRRSGGVGRVVYRWDLNNDLRVDDIAANPTFTYTRPNSYVPSLYIFDSAGNSERMYYDDLITVNTNILPVPGVGLKIPTLDDPVGDVIKSFNVFMYEGDMSEHLDQMKSLGANMVVWNLQLMREGEKVNNLFPWYDTTYWNCHRQIFDEELVQWSNMAHEKGLRVGWKICVEEIDKTSNENEGKWNPSDRKRAKESYKGFISKYAKLAEKYNVEIYVISSGLDSLISEDIMWKELVNQAREFYYGYIYENANPYMVKKANYLDIFDGLGIGAYILPDSRGASDQLSLDELTLLFNQR